MAGHLEILAILTCAVFIVWLFRRLHLPAILAYLVAGMIVGEHGFAWANSHVDYEHFAELGIVFLLFTLGLEFSLPKLIAMRHLVLAVGSLQVLLSMVIFSGVAYLLGLDINSAIIIGGILALSSTAIVIRQLSESGAMKRKAGQLSVAVLLFQDVAVVPLLIIIPMLAIESDTSLLYSLSIAMVKGVFVVGILLLTGKWFLPRLFNVIARVRTDELFVLTTLLVTLVASALTQSFGLSMALGAFLAGMMLGESEYKHQLEADIRPYRDILLGLFFVTVGMKFDVSVLVSSPLIILALLVGVMVTKILVVKVLASKAGEAPKDAWAAGIMLAQIGEFSFVLIALASQLGLLPVDIASILLGVGVISMAITPYMIENARKWALFLTKSTPIETDDLTELPRENKALSDHVVICGFGRVGQTVSRFLKGEKIPFVAIDIDPLRTTKAREAGENVLFGSSRQAELLTAAQIHNAKLVVIAFGEDKQAIEVIQKVRSMNDTVPILVRTRGDDNLLAMQKAGANEVVPEILEGSLMLVSQVLTLSGIALPKIFRTVQKERKSHYNHLHGFYQGEHTDMSTDAVKKIELANAITLTKYSYAVGKTIAEMNLANEDITVVSLTRDKFETETPAIDTVLQALDRLIIRGVPKKLERAERVFQEGH